MSNDGNPDRFEEELAAFQGLWDDGYFEGDPLNPHGQSRYPGQLSYMSVLHVVYLTCIKPYVSEDTVALEIGPGRGAWTRALLKAKEIWCLDAVSAKDNRFWEYVGRIPKVKYSQVVDFSCNTLPDDKFDYLFSFGVFCHISFDGIQAYMENLYPKLKEGADCFVMIADYNKYNSAYANMQGAERVPVLNTNEDQVIRPGRWYHAGREQTCNMLVETGYKIVDEDVGALHRDVIIHFQK